MALAALVWLAAAGGGASATPTQGPERQPALLPVERSRSVFFASVTVNGQGPFWFTVDTGATLTVIDPETAGRLTLVVRPTGARANVGVGTGATNLATTAGAVLRVGRQPPFTPEPLYVVPVKDAEAHLGHRIDGVLGTDFLRRFVVEFDYAAGLVRLHPASAVVANVRNTAGVAASVRGNVLTVPATLTLPDGRVLTPRLLVDTGNSGGLSLNTPFVRTHRLDEAFPATPGRNLNLRVSVGVNGVTTSRVVSFASFALGAATLPAPDVALSTATDGLNASPDFDGIIGADVLRLFTLVIDYPRRVVTLHSAR